MDKIIGIGIGIPFAIAALISFVMYVLVPLFQYLFWFIVLVAAAVGLVVFTRKLLVMNEQERVQRELDEERRKKSRRQREELEALHTQVRNAYHNIFDGERGRSQPRIGP